MTTQNIAEKDESTLKSWKPFKTFQTNCKFCKEKIEFSLEKENPNSTKVEYLVECYKCLKSFKFHQNLFSKTKTPPRVEREESHSRLGTDKEPIDTTFYDLLEIHPTATASEIKKAYYTAAIKSHPDKNTQDPTAESRFKSISEAYQVLSDPSRRQAYNKHGISKDISIIDPTEFFRQQFGGEKFVSIIGEISIAKDFKSAIDGETLPGREDEQSQRIIDLSTNLITKLELYTSAFPLTTIEPVGTTMAHLSQEALSSFRILSEIEVSSLLQESYGKELLGCIGYTYTTKSEQWMALLSDNHLWRKTWDRLSTGIREKAHIIVEAVTTVKSAIDLQTSFTKLQEIGEGEERRVLEEEAATKGMEALWRGSKLEVESVLRQVCDRVLGDESVEVEVRRRRGVALKVLGEVYQNAE